MYSILSVESFQGNAIFFSTCNVFAYFKNDPLFRSVQYTKRVIILIRQAFLMKKLFILSENILNKENRYFFQPDLCVALLLRSHDTFAVEVCKSVRLESQTASINSIFRGPASA